MFDRLDEGRWWDKPLTLAQGCGHVSPGCDHCWSEAISARFKSDLVGQDGKWLNQIRTRPDKLDEPLKRKAPTAYAVWNDLFHEGVPFSFIEEFWNMAAVCETVAFKGHVFMVLTKRPERMLQFFKWLRDKDPFWLDPPLENIWLGATVEHPDYLYRVDQLLQAPASVRFLSLEPLLGNINLRPYLPNIDWVIPGCESGPRRRKANDDWYRDILCQCREFGVPVFLKQMEIGNKVVHAPMLDGYEYLELPKGVG